MLVKRNGVESSTVDRVHRSPLLMRLHYEGVLNPSAESVVREYGWTAAYAITAVSDKRVYRLSSQIVCLQERPYGRWYGFAPDRESKIDLVIIDYVATFSASGGSKLLSRSRVAWATCCS